jgi:hypothetical protein
MSRRDGNWPVLLYHGLELVRHYGNNRPDWFASGCGARLYYQAAAETVW